MTEKPPPGPAPAYATLYPGLCDAVRPLGYALALHGSVRRDLDLVAVPWTEDASPAADVAEAIRAYIGGFIIADHQDPAVSSPATKPHGRLAYAIHFETGGDFYVDLSVMPRRDAAPPAALTVVTDSVRQVCGPAAEEPSELDLSRLRATVAGDLWTQTADR